MKQVSLKFNSSPELQKFGEAAQLHIHDLDLSEHIIICTCSEAEIELAKNGFNAIITEIKIEKQND